MREDCIKQYISPILDKSLKEYKINCPLHFFALGKFKEVLSRGGYEITHPEGIFFHRSSRELIYIGTEGPSSPYMLEVLTTLDFEDLESLFSQALCEKYKNNYVLIEGSESHKVQSKLDGPNFDEIKYTLPDLTFPPVSYQGK